MTIKALSAVFSEAPACPNEAEMDTQMEPRSTNSTQWVILGHAAGNTSKAKQSTVGQDAPGGVWGGRTGGGWVKPWGGGRDVPHPSRTHPVTATREEEERKGRIRREDIQGKEMREERMEDKFRHADIPATQGRRIYYNKASNNSYKDP